MHEVVFSLTVLNLALEVLEGLLLADEVLQLVGRGDLHHDIGARALVDFLLLEDIADMAGLDIHLQGALLLVDNDARGKTLLHIALELAISGVSRRASGKEGAVATQEHPTQHDGNDQIDPGETDLRTGFLVLVVFAILVVFVHIQSRLGMLCKSASAQRCSMS